MSFSPKGIIIPVVTPMHEDGSFNEAQYRRLLHYFMENGVDGVFPFGTTGEYYAVDDDTYRQVLDITVEEVHGRMDVYAGANSITPSRVIELAEIAGQAGANAVSVLTPMFVSQSQREVENFYRTVAEGVDLPIVIYNNKPKTNVTVAPETVYRLAKAHRNIVAVKDSTGDMTNTEEYIRLTRDLKSFHVLMGRDTLIYGALCYGAAGAITSCANIAPMIAVDIYRNYVSGDMKAALEAQFKLSALRIATNMGSFPVVIKEGLELLGYHVGTCAAPVLPLEEAQREKLKATLHEIGLL